MRKLKYFLIASAVIIVSVGALSERSRYTDVYTIYAYNATTGYTPLLCSDVSLCILALFQVSPGYTPAVITSGVKSYSIYYYDVTTSTVVAPITLR